MPAFRFNPIVCFELYTVSLLAITPLHGLMMLYLATIVRCSILHFVFGPVFLTGF